MLRRGSKQRNKMNRNRNSDCWFRSKPKHETRILFRQIPVLHLQHLTAGIAAYVSLLRIQHQIPIAAFASRSDCFAGIASLLQLHILRLQHSKPPSCYCCKYNIIVRRVMVWGYRRLLLNILTMSKNYPPFVFSLCYRQCGQVGGKYDLYTVPSVL